MNNESENIEKSWRKILSKNEKLIVAALTGFFLGIIIYAFFTPNYGLGQESVEITIKKGTPLRVVIESLYNKKIIPNKFNMRVASFIYNAEKKLKAGTYKIPNGLTYFELLGILLEGRAADQKFVTIQEGIWQHKLAQLLRREMKIDSSHFMELSNKAAFINKLNLNVNNLEGYLLPDSYFFKMNSTAEEIIAKLKYEMDKVFATDSIQSRLQNIGMSKHEILTLASIIEGESNKIEEFKRISGVYHNRLKKGIKLQADPTVQYLIRHRKRNNKVYFKDLEINSPSNTYLYYGLPPNPINNPGKDAIIAALYPEKHNFIYFVADGNGGHVFSKTYAQHIINVKNYRAWVRSNQ